MSDDIRAVFVILLTLTVGFVNGFIWRPYIDTALLRLADAIRARSQKEPKA